MDHLAHHEVHAYTLLPEATVLVPGEPVEFRFRILGPDRKPVTSYRRRHERELHLIVVRADLASFTHLHPTRAPDGTWSVELALPTTGRYRAFADLAPADAEDQTVFVDLEPYLGARGHLVAVRASDLAYLHVHPLPDGSGERVEFAVEVPSPGRYRLFFEFLHAGVVRAAAFTVDAADAA